MGLNQLCGECSRLKNARLIIVDTTPRPEATPIFSPSNPSQFSYNVPLIPSLSLPVTTCLLQDSKADTGLIVHDRSWHVDDAARILASRHPSLNYVEDITAASSFPVEVLAGYTSKGLRDSMDKCHLCSLLYWRTNQFEWDIHAGKGTRSIGVPIIEVARDKWGQDAEGTSQPLIDLLTAEGAISLTLMLLVVEDGSKSTSKFKQVTCRQKLSLRLYSPETPTQGRPLRVYTPEDEVKYGFRIKTVSEVRKWLQSCMESHSQCRQDILSVATNQPELPTRLLRLSKSHMETDVDVELVESKFLKDQHQLSRTRYATLSHCWGPNGIPEHLKLLRSNLTLHMQKRSSRSLAETFRQAANFCFALGIEYLWIDALCIIQKDTADWEYEAPQMFHVYARADLNLAGTGSSNSSQGVSIQNHHIMPCRMSVRWHSNVDESIELLATMSDYRIGITTSAEPLNQRGWVYQERILSKRIVEFSKYQILWRCRQSKHGEAYGNRVDLQSGVAPRNILDDIRNWQSTVSDFSMTLLTEKEDKLAAVAGIAQAYIVERGYQSTDYIAGLVLQDVISQLLWTSLGDQSASVATGIAPSWSWASTTSSIQYDKFDDKAKYILHPEIVVTSVSLHSNPNSPFNHSRKGWLQLKAPTLCRGVAIDSSFYREPPDPATNLEYLAHCGQPRQLELVLDCRRCAVHLLKQTSESDTSLVKEPIRVELSCEVFWDRQEASQSMASDATFFFLTLKMKHAPPSLFVKEYKDSYAGLILEKLEGQVGTYKRLGVLVIHSRFPEISFWGKAGPVGIEENDLIGGGESNYREPEIRII